MRNFIQRHLVTAWIVTLLLTMYVWSVCGEMISHPNSIAVTAGIVLAYFWGYFVVGKLVKFTINK
jgi:hypothetical protein